MSRAFEKLLWLAGRLLLLIPPEARMRVPLGLNRGFFWIRGAANAPEWLGIYEHSKQRVFAKLIAPGMTVCDIGANAGFYTLGLSRLVGANGRVLAFEPLPRNCAKIRRHLEVNRITNVELHECAISDHAGMVSFTTGDSDFTGRVATEGGDFDVCSVSLDELLEREGSRDPAVLKIDVEGAELKVLTGAQGLIARAHPTIVLALHGAEQRTQCFHILREAGYALRDFAGNAITQTEAVPDELIATYAAGRSDHL